MQINAAALFLPRIPGKDRQGRGRGRILSASHPVVVWAHVGNNRKIETEAFMLIEGDGKGEGKEGRFASFGLAMPEYLQLGIYLQM